MFKRISPLLLIAVATASVLFIGGTPAQAGGGCHQIASGFSDSTSTTVSIEECKYAPAVVRIAAGDSVEWTNNDDIDHAVTGVAGSWGDSRIFTQGTKVTYRFDETGVYPYFCELHPGMVGAVVVGDGSAVSKGSDALVLAVSEDRPGAAPAQAAAATDGQDGGGSDVGRYLVIAIATAVICAAIVLAGLRLAGRLPRA